MLIEPFELFELIQPIEQIELSLDLNYGKNRLKRMRLEYAIEMFYVNNYLKYRTNAIICLC